MHRAHSKLLAALQIPAVTLCREHMNIVFIGHVDAGKSTIGGQILYLTVRCSTMKASRGAAKRLLLWQALMCCDGRLAALIA